MTQGGATRFLDKTVIFKAAELSDKSKGLAIACKEADISRAVGVFKIFVTQDVPHLTDKETLQYLVSESDVAKAFSTSLGQAIEKALKRPLGTGSGRTINNAWTGCSVTVLDSDGNLLGYYATKDVEGKVNFSVSKNFATMLLERYNISSEGEITNTYNMEFLKNEGLELGKNDYLFLGGVKPFTLVIEGKNTKVYLAVGNCRLTDESFIEELRPVGKVDPMAGAAERALAELIVLNLKNPEAPAFEPYESEFLEGIRLRPILREEDRIFN